MANRNRHSEHLNSYLNKHKHGANATENVSSLETRNGKQKPTKDSTSSTLSTRISRSSTSRKLGGKPPPRIHGKATIQHLPNEMLLEIFGFLGAPDLLRSARVCKLWHRLSIDNSLWEKIYQKYAASKTGKACDTQDASSMKSTCINRCSERRNKNSLRMLKKIRTYTGLPLDTTKALKSAGITFQLSLIDNDGNEHTSDARDIFYHNMSVAVRWHDLQQFPITRVKKIQVFSCNPIFFDDKGKAIKNGPYQRSLLTSTDLKWSSFIQKTKPLAGDENISLYSLPGTNLFIATWKVDGELAFVVGGYHHHRLVERCLKGNNRTQYVEPKHVPQLDDIDSHYGLHGYKCTLDVRNMRKVWWSEQFPNLDSNKQKIADGCICFTLIHGDCPHEHVVMNDPLRLHWKTDLFKGIVDNAAWMDVTIQDEREEIFWNLSCPISAAPKDKSKSIDFVYNGDQHLTVSLSGDKGQIDLELSQMADGRTYVTHLEIKLLIKGINEWFLTNY